MPVPIHDFNCRTRAINIKCSDCQELVWFFSCSCGSKVFFNDLGQPWEQHFCEEYALRKQLELLVDLDRMTQDEVYSVIIKQRKFGKEIDDKIMDVIASVFGRRKSKLATQEVQPYEGITEVSGKVMELNKQINIFSRLGYNSNNEISVKLLGKIGKSQWATAKIRTNPDKLNQCMVFNVFIEKQYLQSNALKQGDFIIGLAESVKHVSGIFWKLTKHDVY